MSDHVHRRAQRRAAAHLRHIRQEQRRVSFLREALASAVAASAAARCDPSGPLAGVWFEATVPLWIQWPLRGHTRREQRKAWKTLVGPGKAFQDAIRSRLGTLGWHTTAIVVRMRWPGEGRVEVKIMMRRVGG